MKIYLDSVGCRLNLAEIESYARQFQASGHELVQTPGEADLVVINTCTVTAQADSDSRQKIRQAHKAGAEAIAVTGCWSTLHPQAALTLPGVNLVVPNPDKDHLVSQTLSQSHEPFDLEPVDRLVIPGARLRTRAFIKVQDGCDNRCTFCVTTIARGAGSSRAIFDVLAEIRSLLVAGAQEVVLTGVHLGSWGKDLNPPLHLSDLILAILRHTDTPRLRLSSLEPWDLEDSFFSLWEDARLCQHLHLPLQSGCAATLRRMARKTTPRRFADLVAAARRAAPDIAITTDAIAGFPGESAAEFEESLAFVRQMDFAGGHAFTYSARPGTTAAHLPAQVPMALRKERNARLRAVFAETAGSYQRRFLGRVLPVLWEGACTVGPEGWNLSGLTGNYLRVHARAPQHLWNTLTPVEITELLPDGLHGRLQTQEYAL